MATGVSRTRWSSPSLGESTSHQQRVTLDYHGKQPEASILLTPPTHTSLLWGALEQSRHRLYFAENAGALAALLRDDRVRGKVRLVYIDPPYATNSIFQSREQTDAYQDLLQGSAYLEFIRQRLIMLRELMAEDGTIYVHLDDKMAFYIKVIMDEIFGAGNFRNWITRKKCNPKNYTRRAYGKVSDYILFYSKTNDYVWNRPVEGWTDVRAAKEYTCVELETGRRFKKVPVHAPGVRNGETGQTWRGKTPPPGKHWQYPPRVLDEMDARGEIYWSATGNPRRKLYLDASDGVPVQDIWLDFRDVKNQNTKITGYPTEKNADLLARIVEASSNPDDLVLDCFSGSGTTLGAASELGRRWIGIDNSAEAITATLKRFSHGVQPMGDFVVRPDRPSSYQQPQLRFDDPPVVAQASSPASIEDVVLLVEGEGGLPPRYDSPLETWLRFLDKRVANQPESIGSAAADD